MIRYKIQEDIFYLGISQNNGIVLYLHFNHKSHIYFVDILEKDGVNVKIKIYMPDGNIHVGWQLKWNITLHNMNELYDGRFNAS